MLGGGMSPKYVCIILLPLFGDYISDRLKFQKNFGKTFYCEYLSE